MKHIVSGDDSSKTTQQASTGIPDDPAISRMYTPVEVAKEEIWKRWNDGELKREVEKFLGNDVPEVFRVEPKVALVRHISSPNREALYYLCMAQQMNLEPLFCEYLIDKFVPENTDKYYLGKLFFYDGKGKCGGEKVTSVKIIDIGAQDGRVIRDIKTLWGDRFPEFHHRMFREMISSEQDFFDMSSWFSAHGGSAKDYYTQYLALFLCHSVLLEEFLTYNKKERGFVEEVFVPAMLQLESLFGVKPLVSPLFHSESLVELGEDGKKWMQYPESLRRFVSDKFVG